MGIMDKLLNPLGDKKPGKYQDISKDSQRIPSAPPSELLLYSRDLAGVQIQKNMNLLNDCRWVRQEYTYPAFDNMNFIYKNRIFSVVIDILDGEGKSYLPEEIAKRQIYAGQKFNLIPCKFPVVVADLHEEEIKSAVPKTGGWNLFNTATGEPVIPEQLATTDKIEVSSWELHHYGIKFVMKYLQSKNMKIASFQDAPDIHPQVWFLDNDGNKCWVVIRTELSEDKEVKKPKQMKEIIRRCFKNDGFFAGIAVSPVEGKKLYRGENMRIIFTSFEKVHSTL